MIYFHGNVACTAVFPSEVDDGELSKPCNANILHASMNGTSDCVTHTDQH